MVVVVVVNRSCDSYFIFRTVVNKVGTVNGSYQHEKKRQETSQCRVKYKEDKELVIQCTNGISDPGTEIEIDNTKSFIKDVCESG
jgi:ribosomal protein S8